MMDLLIKNGTVIGSGVEPFRADVGISRGRIEAVGNLSSARAAREIDAAGMYIAPGFIDMHSHDDFVLMRDEPFLPKILQGITTQVTGNCGVSAAPFHEKSAFFLAQNSAVLGEPVFNRQALSWDMYVQSLSCAPLCANVAPLVGQGNLRTMARGCEPGPASPEELDTMERLLDNIMERGCFGLSSGLIYPPGLFTPPEELVALCRIVSHRGGMYATHIRSEGDGLLDALAEAVTVAKESGVSLQISHLKSAGRKNAANVDGAVRILESSRREGVDLFCDQYPYTYAATTLTALLPRWMHEGGVQALLARLREPGTRKKAGKDIKRGGAGWDNFVALCGWDHIYVTHVEKPENAGCVGRTIAESSEKSGTEPFEWLSDLLLSEEGGGSMAMDLMSEESVRSFMTLPFVYGGTDGLPVAGAHPRLWGSFPRILGTYVRKERLLSWPDAIEKLSTGPAKRLGLKGRGEIAKGYHADIVVFDPAVVADCATLQDPDARCKGISRVFVGGAVVVEDGKPAGVTPGKVLSRGE